MQKWASVLSLLKHESPELAQMHLGNIGKAVHAGTYQVKGEDVSIVDFDVLLDHIRYTMHFPLPPTSTSSPKWTGPDILPAEAPAPSSTFQWRYWDVGINWLDEDGASFNHFPLPIAVLYAPRKVHHQETLLSATALWHLLPCSDPVGRFFAKDERAEPRWDLWTDKLNIHGSEVRAPPKSEAAKKRAGGDQGDDALMELDEDTPDEDDPLEGIKFSQYMMTPRMAMGMLMWLAHVPRASQELQNAVFEVLKTIAKVLPHDVNLPMGKASGGRVDVKLVRRWLDIAEVRDLWTKKKTHLRCPDLSGGGSVSVSWCLWFMCRFCMKSDLVLDACKDLLDTIAPLLAEAIARRSHQNLPSMRLPPATAECYQQVRKALRGDDKVYLAFNSFLSRNVGFGKEDDHTLKEYVYDKKLASYHPFVTRALVASYFTKARSVLAQSMESHRGIAGDFVFFDASRVASKEVLLVQLWTGGYSSARHCRCCQTKHQCMHQRRQ